MKLSNYNYFLYLDNANKYIVFNTLSNRLIELNKDESDNLKHLSKKKEFFSDELLFSQDEIDNLQKLGVILQSSTNEQQIAINKVDWLSNGKSVYSSFDLTIIPSLLCNMSCPYCFEGLSNEKGKTKLTMDEKTCNDIMDFLQREIKNRKTNKPIDRLHIMWFGGEPLMNMPIIISLGKQLKEFAEENNIEFVSKMVSNGLLLSPKNWKILQEDLNLKNIQVTIDGDKETHNVKRPLNNNQNDSDENYERILKNIANKPRGVLLNIRINLDRESKATLENLMSDLEDANIWPQMASEISLTLGYKHYIDDVCSESCNIYYNDKEYWNETREFDKYKRKRYNQWAEKNNIEKTSKLRFVLPNKLLSCSTARNPYGIIVNHEGYIYKCQMKVNDSDYRVQHISEPLDLESKKMKLWTDFRKVDFSTECATCKLLPICETDCPRMLLDNSKRCSIWKYTLVSRLKEQLEAYYSKSNEYVVSKNDLFELID